MIINYVQQYLSGGDIYDILIFASITLLSLLFSLTVHECAHGWMAHICGDDTAYMNGRVTLNPFAHLDPLGALMMLFVGFGWAKPVPVNFRNLNRPKRDIALVSLAGPVSNLIMGFVFTGVHTAIYHFATYSETMQVIYSAFYIAAVLNIGLAVFNLIPLPPLDGSKVLACLLPGRVAARYLMWERYFYIVMLVLIVGDNIPVIGNIVNTIWWPVNFVREALVTLFSVPGYALWTLLESLF